MPPLPAIAILPFLAAILCLAGCAADGPYPSLAPRAVERQQADPEPVAVDAAIDPSVAARVAELRASARAGDAAFDAEINSAERAVANAGGEQSESWIEAQQALSRAQSARGPTVAALFDLDALALERARQPTAASDREQIQAAVSEVQEMAAGQARRLETLRARLGA